MKENQNIEFKCNWRDEYLKWICGYANAEGGILYIGKDDAGRITGLSDSKKLLEDIPNKVRDILGIIVDVNLHSESVGEYLEIVVDSYPYPVSYKGQYHYRSGSTKQELKGAALDRFLLKKQGKHWDGVPVPYVTVAELEKHMIDSFRKRALTSKRLFSEVLNESDKLLLEKLHLFEGEYLKRAAVLFFHPDPEKYVTGAYIKIGFFKSNSDLLYQDEIHGN
ncbi:putative DNA binding domain-containing protein, partial [bacterium]|nr:putative DNA binding domain-containing protein [bacterium]